MSVFLLYIIRSGCCLILFYLGYKALLSRETFFGFNRKVLLLGMILCLVLPLFEFKTETPTVIQRSFAGLELLLAEDSEPIVSSGEEITDIASWQQTERAAFPFGLLFGGIYFAGVLVAALQVLFSFYSLTSLLRNGRRIRKKEYTLVLTEKAVMPFNWGRYVAMAEADYRNSADGIEAHELAHMRKRHSIDLFLMEVIMLFYWFNPFIRLLKYELKSIHEFEADSEVLNSGIDATKYQLLLVKKAADYRSYPFVNSFNQSKLKRRITMMYKNRSKKQARWKLALFVPMAAFAMYAFARPEVNRQLEQLISGEDTKITQSVKSFTCESFNAEFNAYYVKAYGASSLSVYERFDRLKEQRELFVVLVNSLSSVLVKAEGKQEVLTVDELKPALENLFSEKKDGAQALFYFLNDQDTSEKDLVRILEIIGTVAEKHSVEDNPVLIYCDDGSTFPPKSQSAVPPAETSVIVKMHDIYGKDYTININEYDRMDQIREKIQILPPKVITYVDIKAAQTTRMGVITDIQQALREMYSNSDEGMLLKKYVFSKEEKSQPVLRITTPKATHSF